MEIDRSECSAVFHLAYGNDGRWFVTPEGERQRFVTVTDLRGIFAAALAQKQNPVTSDAAESHTVRELPASAEH
jgi:hypothetical protein